MKRNVVLMQVYEETREILRGVSSKTTIDMQELIHLAVKDKYLTKEDKNGKCSEDEKKARKGDERLG